MEARIEQRYSLYDNLQVDRGLILSNENDSRKRSDGRSKPKSQEDILPVLVAVWGKMTPEVRSAYKIFRELVDDKVKCTLEPFVDAVDAEEFPDYYDIINEPMNLFRISEKFHNMEYQSITEVVADIRQIIENCFRYNGFEAFISKQAQKLEVILEQKLNLLSRDLRSKTTIAATNKVKNKEYLNSLLFVPGRRSLSQKHRNGETSLIAMQMNLQNELEGKEKKRLKEKEKKELHSALEEECERWTKEVLDDNCMAEVKYSWEIPSVGIFLCILKDFLNLQDFTYSEFEIGMLFPRKSSLVARIFTSLLVTSFQRKRLGSRDHMKYSIWSEKVKSRIVSWYKIASIHGQDYSASLYGFDADLFQVIGFVCPFQDSEFHELPLKSRMWILKSLCEVALEQDSVLRDYFGELEFIDRQDICLGFDAEGYSYHYISHFGATDIRIYKQKMITNPSMPKLRNQAILMEKDKPNVAAEVPAHSIEKEDEVRNSHEGEEVMEKNDEGSKVLIRTSKRIRTKRSLSPPAAWTTPVKKEKKVIKVKSKDFVVIADDIPSLKALHGKFDGIRNDKGSRKQAEKELEQSLDALYVELKKREANFMKSSLKSRIKIMLECKEWEKAVKSEDEKKQMAGWDSENEEDDEDVDDATVPTSLEPVSINETKHSFEIKTSNSLEGFTSAQSLPSSESSILTKEGRKLRSRRFDVRELFAERTQPQSKRLKLEKTKQEVRTPVRETNSCTRDNHDFDSFDSDESDRITKQNNKGRRNSHNMRRTHARFDEISEHDIQMLRRKRLDKIMQDLKEGKVLTAEEQRNLMHLGLSSTEIEELKKVQKNNPKLGTLFAKSKNERECDPVRKNSGENGFESDLDKSFLSYDGLRALADVASLAKQTSPENSAEKYRKRESGESNAGENDLKGDGRAVTISVKRNDGTKLILVSGEKNRTDTNSIIHVIESKSKKPSMSVGNKTQLLKMRKAKSPPTKNIASNGEVSRETNVNEGKNVLIVTPSHNMSTSYVGNVENLIAKCGPLVVQRKRPNILRKPTTATPPAPQSDLISKEGSSTAKMKESVISKATGVSHNPTSDVIYGMQSTVSNSVQLNASQLPGKLVVNKTGGVSLGNFAKGPWTGVQSNTQVHKNGHVAGQVDSSLKQGLSTVYQQPQTQRKLLDINIGKPIAAENVNCIQNKSSLASLILITQSSPVIGQSGVPLIFTSDRHLIQGKSQDITQPVLLLTPKQPIVQQGLLQGKQLQQQCVLLKQQGDSRLVAYDRQPQRQYTFPMSSVTGHEAKSSITNSCPVTTLKSKLHAAALKRKLGGKNKGDVFQNLQQSITSSISAAVGLKGQVPYQRLQSLHLPGVNAGNATETLGQKNAINIIKTQPKIAPKTVQIVKSDILNGVHTTTRIGTSEQVLRKDAGHSSKLFVGSGLSSLSNVKGSYSGRYSDKGVTNILRKSTKSVGIIGRSCSVESLNGFQIARKGNTAVNPTVTSRASFTTFSNTYSPTKSLPSISTKQPVLAVPGLMSTPPSSSLKPTFAEAQRSTDGVPQATSPILIVPASFSTHQMTVSLPAQIVQLPAQIPSKQEVCGAAESNRGVATAAQLVIVPQTRAPKQVRPAVDSSTAVKALKLFEQAMKPVSTTDSLLPMDIKSSQSTVSEVTPMDLVDDNARTAENSNATVESTNRPAKDDADTSKVLNLNLKKDLVGTSTIVMDKSSVTYSTLVPIPCVEVKGSISEVVTVEDDNVRQ